VQLPLFSLLAFAFSHQLLHRIPILYVQPCPASSPFFPYLILLSIIHMDVAPVPAEEPAAQLVDGDGRGPLAKLPIEWLVQVLDWLPSMCLFQVMSTNREWECGSRYVLRNRDSLSITAYECSAWDAVYAAAGGDFDDVFASVQKGMKSVKRLSFGGVLRGLEPEMTELITSVIGQLEELEIGLNNSRDMIKSISQLVFPKLKKLNINEVFDASTGVTRFPKLRQLEADAIKHGSHVNAIMPLLQELTTCAWSSGGDDELTDDQSVYAFLKQNCKTLTKLQVDNEAGGLNFNAEDGIVFENLEEIRINDFMFVESCPAIKSVTVVRQESRSIFQLPVQQMTSLKVRHMFGGEQVKELYSIISRMENLKHLTIISGDFNDEVMIELLADMKKLESLFIGVEGELKCRNLIKWTKMMHENNKSLSSFVIETIVDESFEMFL
jgi:hypothetical protein